MRVAVVAGDSEADAVRSGWARAAPGTEFTAPADAAVVVVVLDVLDWRMLRDSPLTVAATAAAERGVPCVVLAGEVLAGRRELAAIGVAAAHARGGEPLDVAAERLGLRWGR